MFQRISIKNNTLIYEYIEGYQKGKDSRNKKWFLFENIRHKEKRINSTYIRKK